MKQIVMLVCSNSRYVVTAGEISCQDPTNKRDLAVSRQEFIRAVQPYLPKLNYGIVFGEPAWYLYAALSGRWWGDPIRDYSGDLALHCRAWIEVSRRGGHSWLVAHQTVRACGPWMFPSLCSIALDGGGNQVGDGSEVYKSVPLGR